MTQCVTMPAINSETPSASTIGQGVGAGNRTASGGSACPGWRLTGFVDSLFCIMLVPSATYLPRT